MIASVASEGDARNDEKEGVDEDVRLARGARFDSAQGDVTREDASDLVSWLRQDYSELEDRPG